ncbi:MAG: alpha/beta fold hydrolase [Caldilineaceae bacterium]|nr:alpha/beta fold hydrolase [Caldilineaceae bacterium]
MPLFTHRLPGLVVIGHEFTVPLDYRQPHGEQLTIFVRELVTPSQEKADLPYLIYFQGGPGSGAPRPEGNSGWWKRALQEYRVLLLDQRGTGRSTPVTAQTLARLRTPAAQAAYLQHFRADNIVRDAEQIRLALLGEGQQWSALGQSYGGFCLTHYLSAAPAGLREVIITGGLPSLTRPVDDVYRATYRQVLAKNQLYYERYPEDGAQAQAIVRHLQSHPVLLPDGARLTPRRFQQLGLAFGASNGFEQVHYLLEDAFVQGTQGAELSYGFLRHFEQAQNFETNPIFAILHEAIYCQAFASQWSAERVRAEYPQFTPTPDQPLYFTGEMIYPWMFDEYPQLRPLKAAAELLAHTDDWPHLYDVATLQANTVPCVAAVYYNDMYVERTFSEETAANIGGIKLWITNQYEHNALRADGETLLDRLLAMLRGEA